MSIQADQGFIHGSNHYFQLPFDSESQELAKLLLAERFPSAIVGLVARKTLLCMGIVIPGKQELY